MKRLLSDIEKELLDDTTDDYNFDLLYPSGYMPMLPAPMPLMTPYVGLKEFGDPEDYIQIFKNYNGIFVMKL